MQFFSVARAAQELDGEMRFRARVEGDGMVPGGLMEGENQERTRERTEDLGTGVERSGGAKNGL